MNLHYNIKTSVAVQPWDPSATGVKTGIVIDRAGFDNVEFVMLNGAIAAAGFVLTPIIFAGATSGSMASVADDDLLGTEAAAALSAGSSDNMTGKIGYTGSLRYVRMDLNVVGAATGFHAGLCILSGQRKGPQSDQTI